MKNWRKGSIISLGLLLLFLAAQAIRPEKNSGAMTGPEDITHAVPVPDSVQALLKQSCYDCHSNHTTYLWYDKIAPVSWWIQGHVNDGKKEVNFSTFAAYPAKRQAKKLDEIAEQVEKHEMPLKSYTFMHTDARLTDAQRKVIIDWAKSAEAAVEGKR